MKTTAITGATASSSRPDVQLAYLRLTGGNGRIVLDDGLERTLVAETPDVKTEWERLGRGEYLAQLRGTVDGPSRFRATALSADPQLPFRLYGGLLRVATPKGPTLSVGDMEWVVKAHGPQVESGLASLPDGERVQLRGVLADGVLHIWELPRGVESPRGSQRRSPVTEVAGRRKPRYGMTFSGDNASDGFDPPAARALLGCYATGAQWGIMSSGMGPPALLIAGVTCVVGAAVFVAAPMLLAPAPKPSKLPPPSTNRDGCPAKP